LNRETLSLSLSLSTENATTFLLFIYLFFFSERAFRDAWTDFHKTLPEDAVCIEKVYLLHFSFSCTIKEEGATPNNAQFDPFLRYHFQLTVHYSKTGTRLKILKQTRQAWVVGAYFHGTGYEEGLATSEKRSPVLARFWKIFRKYDSLVQCRPTHQVATRLHRTAPS